MQPLARPRPASGGPPRPGPRRRPSRAPARPAAGARRVRRARRRRAPRSRAHLFPHEGHVVADEREADRLALLRVELHAQHGPAPHDGRDLAVVVGRGQQRPTDPPRSSRSARSRRARRRPRRRTAGARGAGAACSSPCAAPAASVAIRRTRPGSRPSPRWRPCSCSPRRGAACRCRCPAPAVPAPAAARSEIAEAAPLDLVHGRAEGAVARHHQRFRVTRGPGRLDQHGLGPHVAEGLEHAAQVPDPVVERPRSQRSLRAGHARHARVTAPPPSRSARAVALNSVSAMWCALRPRIASRWMFSGRGRPAPRRSPRTARSAWCPPRAP